MKSRNGKSNINIITTLCNQLITTACGIIIPRVLIAAFGSEVYGISVSVSHFLSYITLLESGIGGVARAKLYEPLAKGDTYEINRVYHAIKKFFRSVAGIFILYAIVLGFTYHDIAHIAVFSRPYIFLLIIVMGLSTLAKYMSGLPNLTLIVASQRQYINNIVLSITTILNTIAVVVLTGLHADLIWVKLGSSLIFILRPIVYMLYVKKHYSLSNICKDKAVLEQKWTGIGQHIAYFLHSNTDVVLLTVFANAKLVAVYSVYNLVISSIRAITESFTGGMEAAFGEMIAKREKIQLLNIYRKYRLLLFSASYVLFSCTGMLIVPFVSLYTKGVTDADYFQPIFALILLLAEAINCMALPYASLAVAANRLKQTRWGAYGEAAINIAFSCLLIKWNPMVGIALGTLIATVFRGIYYIIFSSEYILGISKIKLLSDFAGMGLITLGTICIGCRMLRGVVIENFFQWFICGIVVFTVVCVPTVAICVLSTKKYRVLNHEANFDSE